VTYQIPVVKIVSPVAGALPPHSELLVFVPSSKKISQRTLTPHVGLFFCKNTSNNYNRKVKTNIKLVSVK
jgi:hypothetical protein